MKNGIAITAAGLVLAVSSIGCDQKPATNDNHNANNRNVAAVTNNGNVVARVDSDDAVWTRDITREDFDKDKAKYEKRAKDSGSTVGTGANDLWIWTKTKAALAAADDLRDSTINVDVDNDMITLKGSVKDKAQSAKAEQVAKGIEGNKGVKNTLTVAAGGPGGGNTNAAPASGSGDKKH
jgi:hypothetical protein